MVLEHLGTGWAVVSRHLGRWVVLTATFAAIATATCGLGVVLAPNLYRATGRALEHEQPPQLADLLDVSRLIDDLLLLASCALAWAAGQVVPVIGPLLVAVLLVWAPPLVADGHYHPFEAMIVSCRAAVREPLEILLFQGVVLALLGLSVMLCLWPLLFVVPVVLAGTWIHYETRRPELLALGDALGLRRAA